jgi:hypothetical protein
MGRILCWLGRHRFVQEVFRDRIGDWFCIRPKCLAAKSLLSGKVYRREPLFRR